MLKTGDSDSGMFAQYLAAVRSTAGFPLPPNRGHLFRRRQGVLNATDGDYRSRFRNDWPQRLHADTPEPIAPPVSPQQLAQMRDDFRRTDRDARVGLVAAVLASDNLASVDNVPVKDFTIGDIITFLDSNNKTLTFGKVEAIKTQFIGGPLRQPRPPWPRPG